MRKSFDIYIYSIISTKPYINKRKLTTIIEIKKNKNINFILSIILLYLHFIYWRLVCYQNILLIRYLQFEIF